VRGKRGWEEMRGGKCERGRERGWGRNEMEREKEGGGEMRGGRERVGEK
jgi:hypothetical protein